MTTATKTKNTTPNYKLPTCDDDHRCLSTHTHSVCDETRRGP